VNNDNVEDYVYLFQLAAIVVSSCILIANLSKDIFENVTVDKTSPIDGGKIPVATFKFDGTVGQLARNSINETVMALSFYFLPITILVLFGIFLEYNVSKKYLPFAGTREIADFMAFFIPFAFIWTVGAVGWCFYLLLRVIRLLNRARCNKILP